VNLSKSRCREIESFFEYGNAHSGTVNCGGYFDWDKDCCLPKKNCTARSCLVTLLKFWC